MAVTDIQAWADQLETIRLPFLEGRIEAVQESNTEIGIQLSAKIQEFADKFDAHSARITSSQTKADLAKVFADDALVRIYAGDLGSRTYTDTQIQNLRDEMVQGLGGLETYLGTTLAAQTAAQIEAEVTAALAAFDPVTAEIEAIRDQMAVEFASIQDANDQILNTNLPAQSVLLGEIETNLSVLEAQTAVTMAGFEYDTLLEAFDDTQAQAADSLLPLGLAVLQAPASGWTSDSTSSEFLKAPIPSSMFVLNDPVMGRCVELPLGSNATVGQAFPVDFSPESVYQVRLRVRVINNGSTSGVRLRLGVSTWSSFAVAQSNVEKELNAAALPAALQDHIFTCVFSGNLGKLNDQEYSIGAGAANTAVHLSGSGFANKAFFHVRQNNAGVTNGQVRVAILEVKDITPAIDAVKVIKTQLEAELGVVSASLETVEFAVADLDTALAGVSTRLDSRSLPNLIGDPDFSEPAADAWLGTLGATVSVVTHGQPGTTSTKAVRVTDAADGQAGFYSLPHPVGNYANRLLRFRGKARASASGIELYGGTWLWRAGVVDNLTNLKIMDLGTSFQPFDVIIRVLIDGYVDPDQVRLRFYHSGGPTGCWSEVTDMEVYDVTGSEISLLDISAGLSTIYYTQAQTDSAIAESIDSFEATFRNTTTGQFDASGLSNYYTRAGSDSAISAAIDSFEAEFRDVTSGQIKASALTGYYTKAAVDGALSSLTTTLNTAVETKGKTIYSDSAPAVGDRLVQNLWINTTGGANTPNRWNGTAWVVVSDKAATDANANSTATAANLSTNYYTKSNVDAAIAGAVNTFEAEFRDPLSGQIRATALTDYSTSAATGTAISSATSALRASMEAPDGSVGLINASLVTNYYTRAGADSAISVALSSLKSTIENPDGSSLGALVEEHRAALVTLEERANAMLAFRVKAGTASAEIELVAQSNPEGSTSAARISADNILLNGSVRANHVAVNTLTGDKLVGNTITGGKIAGSQIAAVHLVTNAAVITGRAQIADALIDSAHIKLLSVDEFRLGGESVTTAKLRANAASNYGFATAAGDHYNGWGACNLWMEGYGTPLRIQMKCRVRGSTGSTTATVSASMRFIINGGSYAATSTSILRNAQDTLFSNQVIIGNFWGGLSMYVDFTGTSVGSLQPIYNDVSLDVLQMKR